MNSGDALKFLLLGGFLGLFGQGIRALVGLNLLKDYANGPNPSQADVFNAARLAISLVVGFLAGVATALVYVLKEDKVVSDIGPYLLSFAGAGYVGTDVIEAFYVKYFDAGSSTGLKAPQATPEDHSTLLRATDIALKGAPSPPDKSHSGWVNAGIKNPGSKTIQQNVRACFNNYEPLPPSAPPKYWTTQLNTMFKGSDPDWPDASSQLVADPRSPFHKDGLYVSPVYIYQKWQIAGSFTLSDFVDCISACYDYPKPASS
jgi:hypothetical protein